MATTLVQDAFTDTNGTLATAHTMDTGSGWNASNSAAPTIQSNALQTSGAGSEAFIWTEAGNGRVFISVDVTVQTGIFGIVFRYTDDNNYWRFNINPDTNGVTLVKYESSVPTTVRSFVVETTTNDVVSLQVCINKDLIHCQMTGDASVNFVWTDFFNRSATKHGLLDVAAGHVYDNFQITTIDAYYIATDGSDVTGDGSEGNPWATLQFAHDQMSLGETLKVLPGDYTLTHTSGADFIPTKSIVVSGYSDGVLDEYPRFIHTATLTGQAYFIRLTTNNVAILLERIFYTFAGNRSGQQYDGIDLDGLVPSSYWMMKNCIFTNAVDPGSISGCTGLQFDGEAITVDVVNCVFSEWQDGIFGNSNTGGNSYQNAYNTIVTGCSQIGFRRINTFYCHANGNATNYFQSSQSNNSSGNPYFIDPGPPNYDYRLQYNTGGFGANDSPCVDTGDTDWGTDRLLPPGRATDTIDKGAYGGPENSDSDIPVEDTDLFDGSVFIHGSGSLGFNGELTIIDTTETTSENFNGRILIYGTSSLKQGDFLWTTTRDFLRNIDFGDKPTLSGVQVDDGTVKLKE